MSYRSEVVRVTTTGSAGSATGAATTQSIIGQLETIYYNFHASLPATADTTVTAATHGFTVDTVTNSATDVLRQPAHLPTSTAGVAITNAHRPVVVHDRLTFTIAQGDALTNALVATVIWSD